MDAMTVEPPCIDNARKAASKEGFKLYLLWGKRNNVKIPLLSKTYIGATGLKISADELLEIQEKADVEEFSCELAEALGFCEAGNCPLRTDPIHRLVSDITYAIYDPSTGQLEITIKRIKKRLKLTEIFKQKRDGGIRVNINPIFNLYLTIYRELPSKRITDFDVVEFIDKALAQAEVLTEALDEETQIVQAVLDIITGGKILIHKFEDLKAGTVPPTQAFLDSDAILVETYTLQELLQRYGVSKSHKKIAMALRPLILKRSDGGSTHRLRTPYGRLRFWKFDLNRIKQFYKLETGECWEPRVVSPDLISMGSMGLVTHIGPDKSDDNYAKQPGTCGTSGTRGTRGPQRYLDDDQVEEDKETNAEDLDEDIDFDLDSILDVEEHPGKSPEKNLSDLSGGKSTHESNTPVEELTGISAGEIIYDLSTLLKDFNSGDEL